MQQHWPSDEPSLAFSRSNCLLRSPSGTDGQGPAPSGTCKASPTHPLAGTPTLPALIFEQCSRFPSSVHAWLLFHLLRSRPQRGTASTSSLGVEPSRSPSRSFAICCGANTTSLLEGFVSMTCATSRHLDW